MNHLMNSTKKQSNAVVAAINFSPYTMTYLHKLSENLRQPKKTKVEAGLGK